ncbi:hypothetical protein JRO89_XS11G0159100 [Xanthoceras sorbifolium]|uniref:NAC domain-containing protein n=1 Tax=Xanthoceras sorbifolium TaxID=99658 RepID=A0ABQ8HFQ0_9ROSI|nr:hypothetical protein JRO89_XS11G0159100 [Xanthoceras sorbifolium]
MQFPSMSPYPVGVRFHPTDTELVGFYLYNKIVAPTLLSGNNWVRDCDLYGLQEPSDIWRLFGGDDGLIDDDRALYFFTKLKKKSSNGYRICRRVASGTWAGEDSGEKIEALNVFGFKKRFRYENAKSPQDRAWIMHEFTIGSNEMVLCRLKKNKSGGQRGVRVDRKRKLRSTTTTEEEEEEVVYPFVNSKRPRLKQVDDLLMQQNQQAEVFQELAGLSDSGNMAANHLFSGGLQVPLLLDCSDNAAESSYSSSARLSDSGYIDHLRLDSSDNVIMPVEIGEIAVESSYSSSSTVAVVVPIPIEPSLIEADRYINLDGEEIVIENGFNLAQSSPRGIVDDDYFTLDDLNNLLCFDDTNIAFFTDSDHQLPWL